MLADTRIIAHDGALDVLAECSRVQWPDGSAIGLHLVLRNGVPQMFLRAVRHQGAHWIVFDLRALSRSLGAEILRLPARDTTGLGLYTLRLSYPNAAAALDRALSNALADWRAQGHSTTAAFAAAA